jgi:hypothetical protein
MNDTYGQIKTQAEQITNQTKLLRQQLSGTEGAVIRLSQGSPGIYSDGEIWWHIVNIGRVPATNVVIYATTSDLDVGSGKMISRGPPLRKVFPTVPHTENPNEVASGGPGEIAWYDVPVFTVPSVRWDAFSETRLALALKGTVSYNNGFDAGETIPVCYYFFAYTIIVPATQKPDVRIVPKQCADGRTFKRAKARALCDIGGQKGTIPNGTPCPEGD